MHSNSSDLTPLDAQRETIDVEDYLDHLCRPMVGRITYEEREIIRAEVRAHIAGLVEAHCELGSSVSEATAAALDQFGDPERIGRSMLREHPIVRGKAPLAVWVAMNLGVGAVCGACVFLGLDITMHAMGLTRNICPGPDLVIGAAIGWIPPVSLMRHPRPTVTAAIRTGLLYAGATAVITLLAGFASGKFTIYPLQSLSLILAAVIAAGGIGAVAGSAASLAQRALSRFAPAPGRYIRSGE